MYILTYSDDWGPFKCEFGEDCSREAHSVILTDEEHAQLPETGGESVALYITASGIGQHICKHHLKELLARG
jgi:hypothetical protein